MSPSKWLRVAIVMAALALFSPMLAACAQGNVDILPKAASATQTGNSSNILAFAAEAENRQGADDSITPTPSSTTPVSKMNPATTGQAEQETELKGAITAIKGNTLTVNGQTFPVSQTLAAQLGTNFKIGTTVEIKVQNVNGVVTVVRIELEADITTAPSTSTSPTAPSTIEDDQDSQGKGADDTQPDDHGGKGNGADDTQPDDKGGLNNSGPGKGGSDDGTRTSTPKPATSTPKPTEKGDDKGGSSGGGGSDDHGGSSGGSGSGKGGK